MQSGGSVSTLKDPFFHKHHSTVVEEKFLDLKLIEAIVQAAFFPFINLTVSNVVTWTKCLVAVVLK